MTGCVALRKDIYYIRLSYYDRGHVRRDKWLSTGLSGRGAQKKAMAMINSMIEKYSYLEKSDHPSKMADYLKMWKELQASEVAETTYDGYHTYIDIHLIPYFKALNISILLVLNQCKNMNKPVLKQRIANIVLIFVKTGSLWAQNTA